MAGPKGHQAITLAARKPLMFQSLYLDLRRPEWPLSCITKGEVVDFSVGPVFPGSQRRKENGKLLHCDQCWNSEGQS